MHAVNIVQGALQKLRILAVEHRLGIRKGRLLYQPVCACAVKAHPVILPGGFGIGSIGHQMAGLYQKQIARLQLEGAAFGFVGAFSGYDQMDQIMIADAGAPGMAGITLLVAAVENGKFDIIGIALFKGLLCVVCHIAGTPFCRRIYLQNPLF